MWLISGLRRPLGEGNCNPFQYSCLGNPIDRGIWWAIVHWAAKTSDIHRQILHKDNIYFIKASEFWCCKFETKNVNQTFHHILSNGRTLSDMDAL